MPRTVFTTSHSFRPFQRLATCTLMGACLVGAPLGQLSAASEDDLQQRIRQLEDELVTARAELEQAKESEQAAKIASVSPKVQFKSDSLGTLKIGGATRVNYAIGDYGSATGGPSRASGDSGNFELDTFRFNLDYENGPLIGKAEYRFYNGYNFLHTGWLGYNFEDESQVQVGVNRVPFGPGPYGVSQSWFFDQHYYVGLSDDMDLGVKYAKPLGNWKFDLAYYYSDEGSYAGDSRDSARYSYDVVNETGSGYEERNQFNLRGVYDFPNTAVDTKLGFSLQYGQLDSQGTQKDGDHYAGSLHMVNKWNDWTLATQLTRYRYDVGANQPLGSDKLVQMGSYDWSGWAGQVAAEAWIPAVSLSYHQATPSIPWLDYVIPYIEYSSIEKSENTFNDSELFILGAAWARGGWFIYTDLAFSNGNTFVGNEGNNTATACTNDFGKNCNHKWNTRFNVNFGYYF
uniref:Phosphate-selective porin O and P n=1 Tax=Candidatus Kentrum sp. TUN TaxID=2126343 RepID=A0A450ZVD5_9GAMM|nr:MAG: hypothetical protein BECKTUN1418F_GA0071002_11265 [Candidatus Kentron sp. TUN]VFK60972.1 MAG: hypothetical protein BECKTUN1418D_GA0071000_11405 [Candidatus Kentron sp. TUN]VFK66366.1 MAG: hypothetical protein BECKTUN1418E_GA0071001_11215 [Candidatus Kentron sp. TUN]